MLTWMHWIEPEEKSWARGFGKDDKGPHREIRLTKDASSESGARKPGGVDRSQSSVILGVGERGETAVWQTAPLLAYYSVR